MECAIAGEGTVGVGSAGEVTHATLTGCKVVESTSSYCTTSSTVEKATASNLPWHTALVMSAGATREMISEDGKGKPGFELKCGTLTVLGRGNTSMAVKTVNGGVDEAFDSHSEEFTWTDSGTGTLEGTKLVEDPSSGTVAVGAEVGEWLIKGGYLGKTVIVSSKGALKFNHTFPGIVGGGSATAQCTSASEGNVGAGGAGEMTHFVLSGCKIVASTNESLCKNGETLEVKAAHLPWHTILVTSEGATRDLISEDNGKGTNFGPKFEIKCKDDGAGCAGDTSTAVKAVTGGVDETFDSHSEKSECNDGGTLAIEGTQLVENPSSGTLAFEAAPL